MSETISSQHALDVTEISFGILTLAHELVDALADGTVTVPTTWRLYTTVGSDDFLVASITLPSLSGPTKLFTGLFSPMPLELRAICPNGTTSAVKGTIQGYGSDQAAAEVVSATHPFPTPNVEVSFGSLSSSHLSASLYVKGDGTARSAQSKWRLYDNVGNINAVKVAEGVLSSGTTMETVISGVDTPGTFTAKGVCPVAAGNCTTHLVGYDPPTVQGPAGAPGATGAAGTDGTPITLTFQPGGTVGPRRYITWATVVAAAATLSPEPVTIVFDSSFAAADPTAGAWDFGTRVTFQGTFGGPRISIPDGCTFTHSPVGYRNISIATADSSTTSPMNDVPALVIVLDNAFLFRGFGSKPLYVIPGFASFAMYGNSTIGTDEDPGPDIHTIESGNEVFIYGFDAATIAPHTLKTLNGNNDAFLMYSNETNMSLVQSPSPNYNRRAGLDILGVVSSGTTVDRPNTSGGNAIIGTRFFDTTLGKPIWWSGAAWVDATGAGV